MRITTARTLITSAAVVMTTAPALAVLGFGDIVFDPTIHAWNAQHEVKQMAHWAEELKKFSEFANKQIETIEKITKFEGALTARIGDWKGVYDRANSLRNRAENLKATIGKNFNLAGVVDYGTPALAYSNKGNYTPIQTNTIYGTRYDMPEDRLKRYNSVFAIHQDIQESSEQINSEISDVLTEIADTSKEIIGATDQEKMAKLQEKKDTLVLRLNELDRQLRLKVQALQVQALANENREKLEREARRARINASFKEGRQRDLSVADK